MGRLSISAGAISCNPAKAFTLPERGSTTLCGFLDFDRGGDHKARRFAGLVRRTGAFPVCPSGSTRCDGLGECPEWQRGRTVNPLAYAFVGSSPTSPTTLLCLIFAENGH